MIRTIFRNSFIIGMSVLLLCGILFFGMIYTQIKDDTLDELRQEASYAERGVMTAGRTYLEQLDNFNHITWMDADGNVLYDNLPQPAEETPDECTEIISARNDGEGSSIRSYGTERETTLFYTLRCEDNSLLRLGRPLSATRSALLTISPVLWVIVLVLLISAVLSFRMAKQIVRPINNLDLDHPDPNTYPELAPLIDKMREQKLTIQEEVMQREDMRREFSANVSHELKTPLTSISGFAELLAQGEVSGENVQEFSRDIYDETQRLIALINDIIKLSKLDENAEGPLREIVDLNDLSSGVLDSLSRVAEKDNIELYLSGDPAPVYGVYQLLYEMIYNLCDNAIKYNRPGGKVTVSTVRQEDHAILTVSDTGIGIPLQHQKRVFERFYRVDKSHSKSVGGTGLGLSIVKHGAQFHDAKIHLESEPGSGTVITLTFPLAGDSVIGIHA